MRHTYRSKTFGPGEQPVRLRIEMVPEPLAFSKGGLVEHANYVRKAGRGGDDVLLHLNQHEFAALRKLWGEPTVNPMTGLPEYSWLGDNWGDVAGALGEAFLGGGDHPWLNAAVQGAAGYQKNGASGAAAGVLGSGISNGWGTSLGNALGASSDNSSLIGNALLGAGSAAVNHNSIGTGAAAGAAAGYLTDDKIQQLGSQFGLNPAQAQVLGRALQRGALNSAEGGKFGTGAVVGGLQGALTAKTPLFGNATAAGGTGTAAAAGAAPVTSAAAPTPGGDGVMGSIATQFGKLKPAEKLALLSGIVSAFHKPAGPTDATVPAAGRDPNFTAHLTQLQYNRKPTAQDPSSYWNYGQGTSQHPGELSYFSGLQDFSPMATPTGKARGGAVRGYADGGAVIPDNYLQALFPKAGTLWNSGTAYTGTGDLSAPMTASYHGPDGWAPGSGDSPPMVEGPGGSGVTQPTAGSSAGGGSSGAGGLSTLVTLGKLGKGLYDKATGGGAALGAGAMAAFFALTNNIDKHTRDGMGAQEWANIDSGMTNDPLGRGGNLNDSALAKKYQTADLTNPTNPWNQQLREMYWRGLNDTGSFSSVDFQHTKDLMAKYGTSFTPEEMINYGKLRAGAPIKQPGMQMRQKAARGGLMKPRNYADGGRAMMPRYGEAQRPGMGGLRSLQAPPQGLRLPLPQGMPQQPVGPPQGALGSLQQPPQGLRLPLPPGMQATPAPGPQAGPVGPPQPMPLPQPQGLPVGPAPTPGLLLNAPGKVQPIGYGADGQPDWAKTPAALGQRASMPMPPARPMMASGGHVSGPGTGRSDDIPARLSDGEYVMDAESMALLGDGSVQAGAAKLDQLRKNLRMHKGSALSQGKFSPKAKEPAAYMRGK